MVSLSKEGAVPAAADSTVHTAVQSAEEGRDPHYEVPLDDDACAYGVSFYSFVPFHLPDDQIRSLWSDLLPGIALEQGLEVLYGTDGNDHPPVRGGTGVLFRSAGGMDIFDAGAGYDILDYSGQALPVRVKLPEVGAGYTVVNVGGLPKDLVRDVEGVVGGAGNDLISGNSGDNTLFGSAGDDVISGSGGLI